MKKGLTILCAAILVVIILGSSQSMAAGTQWFPSEGATSEYTVSHRLVLENGTRVESNTFDIWTFAGSIKAYPSICKYYFTEDHATHTSLVNETTLSYRYSYTSFNQTDWVRHRTIIYGPNATEVLDTNLHVYFYEDEGNFLFRYMYGIVDYVKKNGFFTSISIGAIPDYIDCTVNYADILINLYQVYAVQNGIIAQFGTTHANYTILADSDTGRVVSHETSTNDEPVATGIKTVAIVYTLVESSSSGIPSFNVLLTAFSFLIGVLLIRIITKRRLLH